MDSEHSSGKHPSIDCRGRSNHGRSRCYRSDELRRKAEQLCNPYGSVCYVGSLSLRSAYLGTPDCEAMVAPHCHNVLWSSAGPDGCYTGNLRRHSLWPAEIANGFYVPCSADRVVGHCCNRSRGERNHFPQASATRVNRKPFMEFPPTRLL